MIVFQRLLNDNGAKWALAIIAVYILLGTFAPIVTPYDPNTVNIDDKFAGMSFAHWLGTDHLGRDILTRLIFAIRPSFLLILFALACSVLIGTLLGFISGYFGRWVDALVMRICDVMLSFPTYVMTLALIGVLGIGLKSIIVALIITRWAWFCRIIRTSVMQYRNSDDVKFARTIGLSHVRIIMTHILPRTLADIAIISTSSMVSMILQISGFSFLGLGVKAPTAEWGMMMNEARKVMFSHPELMFAPGIAIIVIVLAVNFLSDALQIAIDPKLSQQQMKQRIKKGWI
ncbi:nickel/cobalt ABC transporter permease [Staphylococcus pseudintermedius]|uniref:staphylopine uptake ABC transporter permease subunit CntC n=1 Tax=Staphylococcus pseudintermedius TaxID=283734 RepID=UPI000BBC6960|nr:nickel/cobalt ABC transporter permease [Staphylococcus pseudintermedius]EGQ1658928.1 ABC transporter permease subunit [Staphylococcus pseudintermedius]EGQ1672292.1 ABC transporter permease subunit [Staphylococcus pseudintermedius]EGQ1713647.1 ABC transporter permease subunit [Staphylococcus pseudintermedius]EGQ2809340.1 ABC transporter permease subunit [Staphylococcus pseudintermedius]EGQ2823387.1 ABC transporter permease subunit [Staphylococcus pseudintermedius]